MPLKFVLFILHFTRGLFVHPFNESMQSPHWQSARPEWLLGCSIEEMSRLRALEVLGISSAMLEEDKAKILGSLGVKAWGNPGTSTVVDEDQHAGGACNVFSKRRHTTSEAPGVPAPVCGMAAPAPTRVRPHSYAS